MAKQRTPGKEAVTADERLAFRTAVKDVKPLAPAGVPEGAGILRPPARRRRPPATIDTLHTVMPLIDPLPIVEGSGETHAIAGGDALSFQRAGVRNGVLRQLRRGLYPIEDELDLHGLTQIVARDYLAEFLEHSRDAGRRCVRIIHGKGHRSGSRGPLLKIAVDLWLRRHSSVMAFTSARPIDGGTGALYVLLRA